MPSQFVYIKNVNCKQHPKQQQQQHKKCSTRMYFMLLLPSRLPLCLRLALKFIIIIICFGPSCAQLVFVLLLFDGWRVSEWTGNCRMNCKWVNTQKAQRSQRIKDIFFFREGIVKDFWTRARILYARDFTATQLIRMERKRLRCEFFDLQSCESQNIQKSDKFVNVLIKCQNQFWAINNINRKHTTNNMKNDNV